MPKNSTFRKFPLQPEEVWQIAALRFPQWVKREDGEPARPWTALCLSTHTGQLVYSEVSLDKPAAAQFRELVAKAMRKWKAQPVRLEVADHRTVVELSGLLAGEGIAVEQREVLPELEIAQAYLMETFGHDEPDGLLSMPGVTVERVAAFADAAVEFSAAAPWRHLSLDDTLHVEAPGIAPELRGLQIYGPSSGVGLLFQPPDAQGMGEALEAIVEVFLERGLWTVSLGEPTEVPTADLDLWEKHDLPLARGAYPVPIRTRKDGWDRPDASLLAFFEGVLRALAATTEEEMDTGRWTKKVVTAGGKMRITLSLPGLLNPSAPVRGRLSPEVLQIRGEWIMADMHREQLQGGGLSRRAPVTRQERAQELVYDAWGMVGRRQIILARQALDLWPDCIDALVILAQRASDPQAARDLYARGVAAGERVLGREVFEEAGRFWGLLEARPYMRARFGLGMSLWHGGGAREEAVEHFRELLRLDPNDHLGARHILGHALLTLWRHDELEDLFARYPKDAYAERHYSRVLLAFRCTGDALAARHHLVVALKYNRHVPKYLLGHAELPGRIPSSVLVGSEDEAATYAFDALALWKDSPGALDWLRARALGPVLPEKNRSKRRSRADR
jgi:hypothetical protein